MKEAIILAGGKGTRLRSIVSDVPKPMADVGNKPFLCYLFENLEAQGFNHVILSVGYKRNQIQQYFGEQFGKIAISYAIEDQPLGTGGAIRLALKGRNNYPLLVINGDTYLDIDFSKMLKEHLKNQADITIALTEVKDGTRYGQVKVDHNRITEFDAGGTDAGAIINTGTYILSKSINEQLPNKDEFSFEKDFLEKIIQKIRACAFIVKGDFIDIGIPDDYMRAQKLLVKNT